MNKQELLGLIDKYLEGSASAQEILLLERYYNSFQHSEEWNEAELGNRQQLGADLFARLQKAIQKE